MAAYSKQTGADNVVYRAKISYWTYLVPMIIVVLGVVLFVVSSFVGGLILVVGLVMLAKNFIYAFSSELYITDKFTIAKYGLIKRETIEMLNGKVESIMVNQSIIGRILNYGDIMIVGAGSASPIRFIDSPLEFRRQWLNVHEKSGAK